jgi:hypothetical protein
MHAAAGMARGRDVEVVRIGRSDAVSALAEDLDESPNAIERAIEYLTHGPRERFLPPPSGRNRDALPSRFTRRWSYTRRPLIRVVVGDHEDLVWGRRHPLMALRVIIGQLLSGRYQDLAEGEALRAELGRVAQEAGHVFEQEVAEAFRSAGLRALVNVTSVGSESLKNVDGRDLGDIDVLVGELSTRTLWVVECKDLTGALTPADVVDEMTEHFGGSEDASVARVEGRRAWIEERRAAALRELQIQESAESWRTKSVVVTGDRVMAPLIRDMPVPVVAASDLPAWIAARRTQVKKRRRRGRRGRR